MEASTNGKQNGQWPKTHLNPGESRPFALSAPSSDSSPTVTVRRTADHCYSCSCPAWRRAGGVVAGRTCRHLVALLGGAYEEARLQIATTTTTTPRGAGEAAPVRGKQKEKAVAAARKRPSPCDDDEDDQDDDDEQDYADDQDDDDDQDDADNVGDEGEEEEEGDGDGDGEGRQDKQQKSHKIQKRHQMQMRPKRQKKEDGGAAAAAFRPLLAHRWDEAGGPDPTGWWVSEKLDGVRAVWHGDRGELVSRAGNRFDAPAWFTARLPRDVRLDGELFTARDDFQRCVSIVRSFGQPDRWKFAVSFRIFDVPSMGHAPFEERIAWLERRFARGPGRIRWVEVVPHERCRSRALLLQRLTAVCAGGGEGLMLREPRSRYVEGRSHSLLKVKRFLDADAVVHGHEPGQGRNAGCTGALRVEMLDPASGAATGTAFRLGTGLTDHQRRHPPPVGAIVVYRYQALSARGVPRFPTFVGQRAD